MYQSRALVWLVDGMTGSYPWEWFAMAFKHRFIYSIMLPKHMTEKFVAHKSSIGGPESPLVRGTQKP